MGAAAPGRTATRAFATIPPVKILVIGNPVSGGGRTRRRVARLVERLQQRGHHVELSLTQGAGDASKRAAAVNADVDRLVVAGGDGTLNEVLNGLPDPSSVPLAQLATGTANILAHELKFPYAPEAVAELVHAGPVRRLDMGLVGKRRFLMVVSCGFDAMVAREIQRTRGSKLGYVGYVAPILRVLRVYRRPRLTLQVDDGEPVQGELAIISNTRNYGGLFTVADRARSDSGHLDICVMQRATVPGLLKATVGGLTGGVSGQKGILYLTGQRISLGSDEPSPVEVDGDYYGTTPIEITMEPSVVPVVVPASD